MIDYFGDPGGELLRIRVLKNLPHAHADLFGNLTRSFLHDLRHPRVWHGDASVFERGGDLLHDLPELRAPQRHDSTFPPDLRTAYQSGLGILVPTMCPPGAENENWALSSLIYEARESPGQRCGGSGI